MAVDIRKKIEVEALSDVLEDLDYYKLLKLRAGAPIPEVEGAFARQSQEFHPDRFFGVRDPRFMKKVTQIFKKVTEAYQVLRDPELKKMYDTKLGLRDGGPGSSKASSKSGGSSRKPAHVSKAALEAEKEAGDVDDTVADKRARKYWDLAQIAEMNEDWNGVVMNIGFALTYEKDNVILKEKLAEAKVKMRDKNKKDKNPYKIKII
jgi:DnaJ-class molecular chaperone